MIKYEELESIWEDLTKSIDDLQKSITDAHAWSNCYDSWCDMVNLIYCVKSWIIRSKIDERK